MARRLSALIYRTEAEADDPNGAPFFASIFYTLTEQQVRAHCEELAAEGGIEDPYIVVEPW